MPAASPTTVCGVCHCGCGTRIRRRNAAGQFDCQEPPAYKWNGAGAAAQWAKRKKAEEEAQAAEVATEKRLQDMLAELGTMKHQNLAMQEENSSLKSQNQTLQEENSELKSQIQALQEEKSLLKRQYQALQEEVRCVRRKQALIDDTADWLKAAMAARTQPPSTIARRVKRCSGSQE